MGLDQEQVQDLMDMKKKKRTHLPFISVYSYTWWISSDGVE